MKRILFVVMLMLNITLICSSCGSEKNAIEGYEWLEGTWECDRFNPYARDHESAKVEITKSTYKQVNNFTNPIDFADAKKQEIAIGQPYAFYPEYGDYLALDTLDYSVGIDLESKSVFIFVDQYRTIPLEKVNKEVQQDEDKSIFRGKSSSKKSSILTDAFNQSEYIMFETSYCDGDLSQRPYFIVLHPFVYSEDGNQGIIYYVNYGEDKWNSYREGVVDAILRYYGEYEVIGDYIRVRDIVQINNEKRVESLIYTITDTNDGLSLYGGFPRKRTEKNSYRQITNIPYLIIDLLEKENACHHR